MKKNVWKIALFVLSVTMIFCACACADQETSAAEAVTAGPAETEKAPVATETAVPVDLDLSVMSGTVVYSQVYNMMYDPGPFLNKVIRVAGYYSTFEDTETGTVYHACVIPDATACCAQGLEFVRAGSYKWPEDYPEETTDIIVTGRLELYVENGASYLHLVDVEMKW